MLHRVYSEQHQFRNPVDVNIQTTGATLTASCEITGLDENETSDYTSIKHPKVHKSGNWSSSTCSLKVLYNRYMANHRGNAKFEATLPHLATFFSVLEHAGVFLYEPDHWSASPQGAALTKRFPVVLMLIPTGQSKHRLSDQGSILQFTQQLMLTVLASHFVYRTIATWWRL